MTIAKYDPQQPDVTPTPELPKIQPPSYKSIVSDDRVVPLRSLIAYVEGAPITVEYYSQVLSKHNDLKDIDIAQPNLYQQYQLIHHLEIRVSTALTSTQDAETGLSKVTGSGLIYPMLVPNVGDVFLASVPDGEDGLFRVTSVERKTFNRDSAFAIEYDLLGYVSQLSALFADINDKVIREYHFLKDRLIEGLNPLVTPEEDDRLTQLGELYYAIITFYARTFFNTGHHTLIVPGQSSVIYDPYLVRYFLKIVDVLAAPEIKYIRNLVQDNDPLSNQPTLWSLLLQRDLDYLDQIHPKMGLVSNRAYSRDPLIEGMRFQRFNWIVYPFTPDVTLESPPATPKPVEPFASHVQEVGSFGISLADIVYDQYTELNMTLDFIHPVLVDDYYVLSSQFYTNGSNKTVLEILVNQYLKQEAIDLNKLTELAKRYPHWGRLEQFYYLPIILTLIRSRVQGLF